jgi:hypothetical protein
MQCKKYYYSFKLKSNEKFFLICIFEFWKFLNF